MIPQNWRMRRKFTTFGNPLGYINEKPLRQLCKVINAANIDLKFSMMQYTQNSAPANLRRYSEHWKCFEKKVFWLEITNLIIPTWTDDFDTDQKNVRVAVQPTAYPMRRCTSAGSRRFTNLTNFLPHRLRHWKKHITLHKRQECNMSI